MLLKMDSYASVLEIVRVVAMVERCHVRSLSYLSRSEFIDNPYHGVVAGYGMCWKLVGHCALGLLHARPGGTGAHHNHGLDEFFRCGNTAGEHRTRLTPSYRAATANRTIMQARPLSSNYLLPPPP